MQLSLLSALQVYSPISKFRTVKVAGNHAILVPARTITVIEGTCKPAAKGQPQSVLLERHVSCVAELPKGVTVGAALVTVNNEGRVPMQVHVANFSDKDVYIPPRTPIGALKPAAIVDIGIGKNDIADLVSKLDIGELDETQQE